MKRQLFAGMMALMLLTAGVAIAQTTGQALPPSQQVDQSGEPETGTGMDVDVDAGENAEGLVDVDVTRQTDRDTAAQGEDPNRPVTGTTNLQNDRTAGAVDTDRTTGTETSATDMDQTGLAGDQDLPGTASELPALALLGLLALAGAFALRFVR